ncbi:hypothetical protein HHK36_002870 [Tetracentron sinense]|uniref:Uncharacterized protein n=1 Tax=Tetracentron sinense TaxID=13715 RepID=A0A835DNC9_TETSI|nr:hypothetical protein HHK36_002870 [Tetracentron sinense]
MNGATPVSSAHLLPEYKSEIALAPPNSHTFANARSQEEAHEGDVSKVLGILKLVGTWKAIEITSAYLAIDMGDVDVEADGECFAYCTAYVSACSQQLDGLQNLRYS